MINKHEANGGDKKILNTTENENVFEFPDINKVIKEFAIKTFGNNAGALFES